MKDKIPEASTQYGDWVGEVCADDAHVSIDELLKCDDPPPDESVLVALSIYLDERDAAESPISVDAFFEPGATKRQSEQVPVERRASVHLPDLLRAFKRIHIVLKRRRGDE